MIYPIRSIVVGIAHADRPDPMIETAFRLADRTGATLHLTHAFELPDLMWDAYARMGYASEGMLRRHSDWLRGQLEEQARVVADSRRIRFHVVPGPAAPQIQRVAMQEEADLILVGSTRHGTITRTILGTTAQRVLRNASVPVLVVRGQLPHPPRLVLLTTDLSTLSAGIHETALDVLETLFHHDPPGLRALMVMWYGTVLPPPLGGSGPEQAAFEELEQFLSERRDRPRPVEPRVRIGDPAKEIVAESVDCGAGLIVMGTHGRTGARRWLLGSVAEAVVRASQVSVLVIPAQVEARRWLSTPRLHGVAPEPRAPVN